MVERLRSIDASDTVPSTAGRFRRAHWCDGSACGGWACILALALFGCRRLEPSLYRPSTAPSAVGHVAAPPPTNTNIACYPQTAEVPGAIGTARGTHDTLVCDGDDPDRDSLASESRTLDATAAGNSGVIAAGGAGQAGAGSLSGPTCDEPAAAGASGCSDAVRAAGGLTPSRTCHLLVVGDSLSDPKSGGGGYLLGVTQRCRCAVTNIAKGGAMVNQMRAQLLEHLEDAPHYSHAVVFGGVNDLYSDLTAKRTVAKIAGDLERMYRAMQRHRTEVIAITVTPWGGFRRYFTDHRWQNTLTLNRWIREGQERGLVHHVVDGEQLLACGDAERLCDDYAAPYRDGLHFGPLGHQRLAQQLVQALGPAHCSATPDVGSN